MGWKEQFKAYVSTHRWTITLILAGVVLFVLFLTLGFWRALLLAAIVAVCFLIGHLLDKGGWDMVKSFFNRFLPR